MVDVETLVVVNVAKTCVKVLADTVEVIVAVSVSCEIVVSKVVVRAFTAWVIVPVTVVVVVVSEISVKN